VVQIIKNPNNELGALLGKNISGGLSALARQKAAEEAHQRELAAQRELLELMHQQKLQEMAYQQQLQQEEIARQERFQQEERAYRQQLQQEQTQIQRQRTINDLLGLTFLILVVLGVIWIKTKK
jgi:Fe2+ transport system protein B